MLVAGYSGIGKTTLIQELYKPIVRQKGYFVSGKFDQIVRNIPFGALIQALCGLVRQLLTESEDQLGRWRRALTRALGINGGVLVEVMPEIELIIGKQPLIAELGPTEALNRFQLVIRNFFAAVAQPDHPLVVFLDDLQWADAATLSLLEPLLTSDEIPCLLLMGAYRDNEVGPAHPLQRIFSSLELAAVELQSIALGPLQLPDLIPMIHDTLHCEITEAQPLAQLAFKNTAGNPFFVTQFLKTLKQEGYFKFDYERGRWAYEIDAIAHAPMADNVIDLMTHKIQRLSPQTQRALTLAACIGNLFDQDTLAVISERTAASVTEDLRQAIAEGLIITTQSGVDHTKITAAHSGELTYSFLHDRVQQAAYALIPEHHRMSAHLTVGRMLRAQQTTNAVDERIFEIVHHFNLGRGLIVDEEERLGVARLNLSAGRKAKSSTAHDAALGYFAAGLSLLTPKHWLSEYELTFALHLEAAESEYLCGHFNVAERQLKRLLRHAATNLDKSKVFRLRSVQFENMTRYGDAIACAREALALFGVVFPDSSDEKELAVEEEIAAINARRGERSIASLVDLPVMIHPEIRMVMTIMTDMWASAYILGDPLLARLISATMVRLSLESGNVEESAYGYVTHAITVGPLRGDYEAAYELGKLALKVNERFNDSRRRAKIHQQFHAHVNFWRQPMHTCIAYAREACRSGLESGDFLYAAYGAGTELWSARLATQDLAQFVRTYTSSVVLIKKLNNVGFADSVSIILNWARALRGSTETPLSLSDESIDETKYLEKYRGNAFFTAIHAVSKLHLCFLFGESEMALVAARAAGEVVYQLAGTVWPLDFDFWNALTLAANYHAAAVNERSVIFAQLEKTRKSFDILAQNCRENFRCQSLLISAEMNRIADHQSAALDLYEQAIAYAGEAGLLQYLGLQMSCAPNFSSPGVTEGPRPCSWPKRANRMRAGGRGLKYLNLSTAIPH